MGEAKSLYRKGGKQRAARAEKAIFPGRNCQQRQMEPRLNMGKQTEKGSKCTSKNPKNRIIPPNSLVCPPRKKICKGAKKLKKRLAFSARKGYYIVNFHSPAQGRGESKIFKRVENMKQSKLLKKSLAALLAILMVAAMIPMSAFA
ncbi:MAG: hypothetical protein HFE95_00735, partial [Acutalibacter sp.]|nr:hypothetical protein [Acutalibacter sp.]